MTTDKEHAWDQQHVGSVPVLVISQLMPHTAIAALIRRLVPGLSRSSGYGSRRGNSQLFVDERKKEWDSIC